MGILAVLPLIEILGSRPVVKYPCVDFCESRFSLFGPCDFHSDHVFHFNIPVVFIQTTVFQYVTSRVAPVISALRTFLTLWFLSGPRFSGRVL